MDEKQAVKYIDIGAALFTSDNLDSAISAFNKALKFSPNSIEANFDLGLCYDKKGDTIMALKYFKRVTDINPNDIDAQNNVRKLAFTMANVGSKFIFNNPVKALEHLSVADKYAPNQPDILYNVANALQAMGKTAESMEVIKKVIQIDPDYEHAYGQLYLRLRTYADWDEAKKVFAKMVEISDKNIKLKKLTPETPFLSVCNFQDPKRNLAVAKLWAGQDERLTRNIKFTPKYTHKKRGDKIRIGYLSYDFHDHATLHLLMGVLRSHDKKKFKIYGYSYGLHSGSPYRDTAQKYLDVFRDIKDKSDLEAATIVNKDQIDILVDLKGHTSGCRLPIMALKPAPISMTWLGFPGTTGSNYINYILTDKIVTPPSEAKFYTEKILYMPHTYQPTDNQQAISDRKLTRRNVGLPGGPDTFVFSSFNQTHKIEPLVFDSWSRILKKVPNSVLWLFSDSDVASTNLKKEALRRGVDDKRIVIATSLSKPEHLARITLADLALDTFTYNGHTTTSDCLWAGVPVITLKGNHFASRVSASLLTAVGLPELITNSVSEYENLAIELALNPKKLLSIHYSLSSKRLTEPLFNTVQFTKDLEKIYAKIHK